MLMCQLCEKRPRKISYSRHKKGSSGAGGTWALRAQITRKTQKPNLHIYKGMKLCSQCLRIMKKAIPAGRTSPKALPTERRRVEAKSEIPVTVSTPTSV